MNEIVSYFSPNTYPMYKMVSDLAKRLNELTDKEFHVDIEWMTDRIILYIKKDEK